MSEVKLVATRDAYGKALAALGQRNPKVVALDADLSKSTKSNVFAEEFPERFFNMGIAEQGMMDVAAGLASCGKIPFASSFAVFASGRAWEQVRLACGYNRLNVKIVASHAGVTVGEDGATHQANEDIALMRVIPNLIVVVPADAIETERAVFAAAEHVGPVYIRTGRAPVPIIMPEDYSFEFGKAVVLREGTDVSLFACGVMVSASLEAARKLEERGISAEVINLHTIKPLDAEAIVRSVRKTGCAVTAEEHSIVGGLGGAVAEVLVEEYPVPMRRVGLKDCFGESGKPEQLLEKYGMTPADIVAAAIEVIGRKGCCR